MNYLLEDTSIGRSVIWNQINKMVAKNTSGNYPSPNSIIQCVQYGYDKPTGTDKFKNEREQFAKLAATPESDALIGIFDGMTQMKTMETISLLSSRYNNNRHTFPRSPTLIEKAEAVARRVAKTASFMLIEF